MRCLSIYLDYAMERVHCIRQTVAKAIRASMRISTILRSVHGLRKSAGKLPYGSRRIGSVLRRSYLGNARIDGVTVKKLLGNARQMLALRIIQAYSRNATLNLMDTIPCHQKV